MICIYHSRDLDGWMSAAIVKLKYPDVELIGWDYGVPIPDIAKEEQIIMVDVSFPRDIMLNNIKRLIWIDHHFSAMKDIGKVGAHINGRRDPEFAACELTWKFFFPDKKMPEIVRLLGRYDCFGHKGTDEEQKVLEFQYGARSCISNPNDAYRYLQLWLSEIAGSESAIVLKIHHKGIAIYNYLCVEAQQIYARKFDIKFGPVKFACVNQDRFNPVNFGIDYHKDGYGGFCCFWYANGKWTFSLYNDNGTVDCSEICKENGGGGHKSAAGFIKEDINWLFQHTTTSK